VWTKQKDTLYLYDGWNLIAELDPTALTTPWRTYAWGTDLSGTRTGAGGVGGLLWVRNFQGATTGHQFVAYDGNGNVAALVQATTATLTAQYEYGPFGESIRMSGALAALNSVRWSSKVVDSESGLIYYGYRYYDSVKGRWLSRDPIQEEGGPNIYASVFNNSITLCDSDGRFPVGPYAQGCYYAGALIGGIAGTSYVNGLPCLEGCNVGIDYNEKTDTITVRKCEIIVMYGHGRRKPKNNWKFSSPCSAAGTVSCFPGEINARIPDQYLIPGSPIGAGNKCIWNSPRNGSYYTGLEGFESGLSDDKDDGFMRAFDGDRGFGKLIENAIKHAGTLCGQNCCSAIQIKFFRRAKPNDREVGPPPDPILFKCASWKKPNIDGSYQP